jgi:hypothetical protein
MLVDAREAGKNGGSLLATGSLPLLRGPSHAPTNAYRLKGIMPALHGCVLLNWNRAACGGSALSPVRERRVKVAIWKVSRASGGRPIARFCWHRGGSSKRLISVKVDPRLLQ